LAMAKRGTKWSRRSANFVPWFGNAFVCESCDWGVIGLEKDKMRMDLVIVPDKSDAVTSPRAIRFFGS
jgi:hypothetical protein